MFFKSSQLIEILKDVYMKRVLRITVNTLYINYQLDALIIIYS